MLLQIIFLKFLFQIICSQYIEIQVILYIDLVSCNMTKFTYYFQKLFLQIPQAFLLKQSYYLGIKIVLLLPFYYECLLFLFLALSYWLKLSVLNRIGKSKYLCLDLNVKEKAFGFSPLSMILAIGFSQMYFTKLRKSLSIPSLLIVFIKTRYSVLSNIFSVFIKMVFINLLIG